jgi:hypothetical protein
MDEACDYSTVPRYVRRCIDINRLSQERLENENFHSCNYASKKPQLPRCFAFSGMMNKKLNREEI